MNTTVNKIINSHTHTTQLHFSP